MRFRNRLGGVSMGGAPDRVPQRIGDQYETGATTGNRANASRLQRHVTNFQPPVSVLDIARFFAANTVNFTMDGATDVLAVAAPTQYRIVLMVRSSNASPAGSFLYVAFGQLAQDATAWAALPPGGELYLDAAVPQDDVHLFGSAAGVLAVVGYANTQIVIPPTVEPAPGP